MNSILKLGLTCVGGSLGFVGAFTGFSLVLGTPPHEIAMVGSFFPAPPETEGEATEAPPPPVQAVERRPARKAGIGVLDVFQIESPYSSSELTQLAETLEQKLREVDERLVKVGDREQRAEDRERFLDEQYAALAKLRTGLETWEDELSQRETEVERDEAARDAREDQSWSRLAKLFEKGDPADQAARLRTYTPAQAAEILHQLKPARAQEILDALTGDAWKEYAEAYRLNEPR
jgi:flagellar motility protein MotE (MotC chaperone)